MLQAISTVLLLQAINSHVACYQQPCCRLSVAMLQANKYPCCMLSVAMVQAISTVLLLHAISSHVAYYHTILQAITMLKIVMLIAIDQNTNYEHFLFAQDKTVHSEHIF